MTKIVSLLTLVTVLFTTAGCGSKKQTKTMQPKHQIAQKEQIIDATIQDKKEDYAITA